MTYYLLDTNILSHIARYPTGPAAIRSAHVGYAGLCTSIVVACEIHFGLELNPALRSRTQILALLANVTIQSFEEPADQQYARIRTELKNRGTPIGAFDMLIAAHAMALDCTLVTDNSREFERIDKLRTENWLRE